MNSLDRAIAYLKESIMYCGRLETEIRFVLLESEYPTNFFKAISDKSLSNLQRAEENGYITDIDFAYIIVNRYNLRCLHNALLPYLQDGQPQNKEFIKKCMDELMKNNI
jgi:hypothetical protein